MAVMDKVIGATGHWLAGIDANAPITRPRDWLQKIGGYAAVNRLVGFAIPFAPRNGFRVEEVRPGYVRASIKSEADLTGRAAFTLEGELYDANGELVATSLAHYRVRKKGFQAP